MIFENQVKVVFDKRDILQMSFSLLILDLGIFIVMLQVYFNRYNGCF